MEKNYDLLNYVYIVAARATLQINCSKIERQIKEHEEDMQLLEEDSMDRALCKLELDELKDQCNGIINALADLKNFCKHNLVLYLGKQYPAQEDIGYAVCLECGESLYLKGIDKNLDIDQDSIIDVTGIIPDEYIYTYDGGANVLALRAMERLINLGEANLVLSLDEVKANILEDLVYYTDELSYKKTNPRKRARVISGRK